MDISTRCNVFSVIPLIQLMEDVIPEEVNREILQTDLIPMEYFVQCIITVLDQLPEAAPETLVVWLQLLHFFLTEAKSILHRSDPPQRCLDCLRCNPRRLSKQIKKWRVRFNYFFQALERDFSVFVSRREAVIAPVIAPVIPLLKDVIQEEENSHILQTELRPVDNLLLDLNNVFQYQQKTDPEALKILLQLLHISLTEANRILHCYGPSQRQRRLDGLMCNPGRPSKEVKEWQVLFNYAFQRLQGEFSMFCQFIYRDQQSINRDPIQLMSAQESIEGQSLSTDEAEESIEGQPLSTDEEEECIEGQPLSTEIRSKEGQPLSTDEAEESIGQPLSTDEAEESIEGQPLTTDEEEECIEGEPLSTEIRSKDGQPLSTDEAEKSIEGQPLSADEAEESIEGQPLSTDEAEESLSTDESEESIEGPPLSTEIRSKGQPLSTDRAWMLFKRIAFKDNRIPTDIEEYARNIADECKAFPLAIPLIAAAMTGKTRVDEWKTSLYSMKNADPSFPDTLHPQLYQLLKWSYDALPNSDVKNCFLYCAMYPAGEKIYVQKLVQMWIAEGLVRSKQESHLMDMAIGLSYVNLLVDRCLFQWETEPSLEIPWEMQWRRRIFVEHDICEMAIYIGEEEENGLFKAGQSLQNFPTIHNDEDCKRISLLHNDIQNLPAELPCPKLVSLFLSVDVDSIPSRFLVRLPSLKILHLHSDLINSIPSSVGQLKQLEFISLEASDMEGLPEEICHLSSLQFLDLENCRSLQSLPPKIGELKNLKYLSLLGCSSLKVIPHEISQLTSLTTLDADGVRLSVEAESEANIWSLKGLGNLTMLRIEVNGFKDGIMGTWLDMRHLCLVFGGGVKADLPHDMTNMRKLQSFRMWHYSESSLPDYSYKFQHLEDIDLIGCDHLRELSPLERLPSLKGLLLEGCAGLKELGIGFSGRPSGFLMLEKLVLIYLDNLESIAGPLNNGVWNESTLPKLRILKIYECPNLKRFPMGTDKLLNLSMIAGEKEWWHNLIWEDHDMQVHLEKLFKEWW